MIFRWKYAGIYPRSNNVDKKNVDMKHVSGKGTGYQNVPRGDKLATGNVPDGIFIDNRNNENINKNWSSE